MSNSKTFPTGSIVKLKSGGPNMTVKEWSSYYSKYICQWFAGKKLEEGKFEYDSLEEVVPEPKAQ